MPNNNYGGARAGAGRPAGRKSDATLRREAAWAAALERLADAGPEVRPLDVVLILMREALAIGDLANAVTFASLAMPYCHARLAPVAAVDPNAPTAADIGRDTDPDMQEDDELPRHLRAA